MQKIPDLLGVDWPNNYRSEILSRFYVDLFPDDVDRWKDTKGPCGKTRVCEKGRELHMPPIQEEYDLKVTRFFPKELLSTLISKRSLLILFLLLIAKNGITFTHFV